MTELVHVGLRIRRISGVISTDDIIPGRYKHMYTEPCDLAPHVFEHLLPGFAASIRNNDILCCDNTFGIGSSREQAVSALLASGLRAILAPRFGRIFFRNSWNLCLFAIEIDEGNLSRMRDSSIINIDLATSVLTTSFAEIPLRPLPPMMLNMVKRGGILSALRSEMS